MVATHRVLQTTAVFMAEALWRTLHRVFIHSSLVNSFIFIYFPFLMCVRGRVHVCVYACFACVWAHMCTCMCKPEVNVRNQHHPLFHFIHWGRVPQSNPELADMASFASLLVLGMPCTTFPDWNCRWATVFMWVYMEPNSHFHAYIWVFNCWVVSPSFQLRKRGWILSHSHILTNAKHL